jgi:hypothetical protein
MLVPMRVRRLVQETLELNWLATVVLWLLAWALVELVLTGWGRSSIPRPVHFVIGGVLLPAAAIYVHRGESRRRGRR